MARNRQCRPNSGWRKSIGCGATRCAPYRAIPGSGGCGGLSGIGSLTLTIAAVPVAASRIRLRTDQPGSDDTAAPASGAGRDSSNPPFGKALPAGRDACTSRAIRQCSGRV